MYFIPVALGIGSGMAACRGPRIGPVTQGADHNWLGVLVVHPLGHHRGAVAHSGRLDVGLVGVVPGHRHCRRDHRLGVVDNWLGVVDHRLGVVDHGRNRVMVVTDGWLHSGNWLSHLVNWLGHGHCWLCHSHRLDVGPLLHVGGLRMVHCLPDVGRLSRVDHLLLNKVFKLDITNFKDLAILNS